MDPKGPRLPQATWEPGSCHIASVCSRKGQKGAYRHLARFLISSRCPAASCHLRHGPATIFPKRSKPWPTSTLASSGCFSVPCPVCAPQDPTCHPPRRRGLQGPRRLCCCTQPTRPKPATTICQSWKKMTKTAKYYRYKQLRVGGKREGSAKAPGGAEGRTPPAPAQNAVTTPSVAPGHGAT